MDLGRIQIRPALAADVPRLLAFIRELAEYERLSDHVTATEDDLRAELFGPRGNSEAFIAEVEGQAVGYAWIFANYSTFRGRSGIYLEDLYVQPEYRHRGVGKAVLAYLARLCRERGCVRLQWAVLNWNEPALRFYRSLGAAPVDDWTVYALDEEGLGRLAGEDR